MCVCVENKGLHTQVCIITSYLPQGSGSSYTDWATTGAEEKPARSIWWLREHLRTLWVTNKHTQIQGKRDKRRMRWKRGKNTAEQLPVWEKDMRTGIKAWTFCSCHSGKVSTTASDPQGTKTLIKIVIIKKNNKDMVLHSDLQWLKPIKVKGFRQITKDEFYTNYIITPTAGWRLDDIWLSNTHCVRVSSEYKVVW